MTGSDAQTDAVVKAGAMAYFPRLLAHPKPNVVKEAAWTVSNVTAGNLDQIQAVINAGLLQPVLDVLQKVGGRPRAADGLDAFSGIILSSTRLEEFKSLKGFRFSKLLCCLLLTSILYR